MPGLDHPDVPPPEVPQEFADAYREAYRRALGGSVATDPGDDVAPTAVTSPEATWSAPGARQLLERWRRTPWFLPAAVAVAALVLVGAAYAVGTATSGHGDPGTGGAMAPQSGRTTDSGRPASPGSSRPGRTATAPHGWTGPLRTVDIAAIAADCTAPPATDSAGRPVAYAPQNAIDGRPDTAWRCPGTAVGQTLVLRLSSRTAVAEVGLIPGYAKTDPESGADRYAENNRITRVRWTLGNGVTVVQRLDPDPSSRAPQLLRVPRTDTDTVTVEILAVRKGPRDTTAISEIRLAAAASA